MKKSEITKLFPKFPFTLPLLLDGATGTELIKAGMPAGICPEAWILDHPNAMKEIQKNYADAGSNAVLAPTFGANRICLDRYGLAEKTAEMNRSLASLSRAAVGNGVLVGGALSPTGKLLVPFGDTDFEKLVDVYREQAAALRDLVDFFMVETNMDLATTRAAVTAVRECTDKPIFVTMTVESGGKTMSGDDPAACLLTLSDLGISAFGLNCSTGPREMAALLRPLVPLSLALGIPLIAKPNAGAPAEDGSHHHLTAEEFALVSAEMLTNGIFILGGCCGTDKNTIAAIREKMETISEAKDIQPLENAEKYLCNARTTVLAYHDEMPEPITPEDADDFPDEAEEAAEEYGFALISLRSKEDALLVLEASPLFSFQIAVTGDQEAIALLRRRYAGKILTV